MKMKVTVTCYGKTKIYKSRKEAIKYFKEGMKWCDPFSSEFERYAIIVMKLESGMTVVDDSN
jgi:hypothetical protein